MNNSLFQLDNSVAESFRRLMYWCDWGSSPKIEFANMDGQSRQELVTRGLYWPNGLTLDDSNNRLYWVDAFLDVLEYYDLKLHKITTLLEKAILLHPFGVTSIDDQLFWTDWYNPVVYKADKKTVSNASILISGLSQPMNIHAYDRNKTLPGKDLYKLKWEPSLTITLSQFVLTYCFLLLFYSLMDLFPIVTVAFTFV